MMNAIWARSRRAIMARVARKPDLCIGGDKDPYLRRWYLLPRNRFFNVYLHNFLRSDEDRALHDHPWNWCSIILKGSYLEICGTRENSVARGFHARTRGTIRTGRATDLHRVELYSEWQGNDARGNPMFRYKPVWTVFITGPRIREWGFQCPNGWVPWRKFLGEPDNAKTSSASRGPGCDQ